MLTPKNVYEHVRCHLLTQMAVSENSAGSCRLRGDHGRKCAVGSLVRDDQYREQLESYGISYAASAAGTALVGALSNSGLDMASAELIELLVELEDIHDGTPVESWAKLLENIGRERGYV